MESGKPIELSLEQEFNLKAFEQRIQPLNLEQSKILLVDLYKQLLLQKAYCQEMFKQNPLADFPNLFE